MKAFVLTAAACVLLSAAFLPESQLVAQVPSPSAAPDGPTPRMPNGRPDLSGVWQRPYVPDMSKNGRGQQGYAEPPFSPADTPQMRRMLYEGGNRMELPFTRAGLADWVAYDPARGDYTGSCFPFGMSRSINSPDPMQIMQDDRYVALLFEQNTWFHIVPIDGRDHPKGDALNPTWFGNSVGRWDGDTLIVDTIGFNGYTRLDTIGHPHSDALHLVQTFRRMDLGHIEHTITIDDPKTYTKPWKNERTFTLRSGELLEYSCEENNKDLWEGHLKLWTPPWVNKK